MLRRVVLACLGAEGTLYLDASEQVTLFTDALMVLEATPAALSVRTSLNSFVVPHAMLVGRAVDMFLAHSVS